MINNEYIDVTATAVEVGSGFNTLKAPVLITENLWDACIKWDESDNNIQGYQEQEARLWDVLFVCGTTLEINIQKFLTSMSYQFHILVIPRDGITETPIKAVMIANGNPDSGNLEIDLVSITPVGNDD
jgi:hypothetical protein